MKGIEAYLIAESIVNNLRPYCDRIHIAGSIRREKEEVKDIEIVCQPKEEINHGLFGENLGSHRIREFHDIFGQMFNNPLVGSRVLKGGVDAAKYAQIQLPEGINLDLFMPSANDYFRQLAIRTGSADYSWKIIATGWKRVGWCGTERGLRKMSDCIETKTPDGKSKWKLINKNGETPPSWQSEEEFFEWLGIKWIEPKERNL